MIKERVVNGAQKEQDRRWRIGNCLVEQRVLGNRVQSKKIGDKEGGTVNTTISKSQTTSNSPSNIPTITNLLIIILRH